MTDTAEIMRAAQIVALTLEPGSPCPACKTRVRGKAEKSEAPRKRGTWSIAIPKDNRENGADVLDSLLDACAHDPRIRELGYEDGTPKYFVLVPVLADWLARGKS